MKLKLTEFQNKEENSVIIFLSWRSLLWEKRKIITSIGYVSIKWCLVTGLNLRCKQTTIGGYSDKAWKSPFIEAMKCFSSVVHKMTCSEL